MFSSLVQTTPHIQAGKLRALGVGGKKRSPILPDVPTIDEAGVPGYEAVNWWGIVAPAGVPQAVVDRLRKEIAVVQTSKPVHGPVRPRGRRGRPDEPGRVRRFHGVGNGEVGEGGQGSRHEGRIGRVRDLLTDRGGLGHRGSREGGHCRPDLS